MIAVICIFCLQNGLDPSAEHVIPRALGGGMVIDGLCTPCNGSLGSDVDQKLTDHFLMKSKREQYGITGYNRTAPDMTRALLGGRGIWNTDGSDVNVHVKADSKSGISDIYIIPSVHVDYDPATGALNVKANMDGRDRSFIEKRLIDAMTAKDVPSDLQEQILAKLDPVETSVQATIRYSIPVNDPNDMRRPIAKIAYELAFRWFGPAYLNHSRAEELRDFIVGGVETSDVGLHLDRELLDRFWAFASPAIEHVAIITPDATGFVVHIKLFDVLVGVVRVTTHADGIFQLPYEPAIRFDATNRTYRDLNMIEFSAPYDAGSARSLKQMKAN